MSGPTTVARLLASTRGSKGSNTRARCTLREDRVVRAIDAWFASVFNPEHLDATCAAMDASGANDPAAEAKVEASRRRIADCDARLARYRSALDAGADPVVVAGWVKDVEARSRTQSRAVRGARVAPEVQP